MSCQRNSTVTLKLLVAYTNNMALAHHSKFPVFQKSSVFIADKLNTSFRESKLGDLNSGRRGGVIQELSNYYFSRFVCYSLNE